MKRKKGSKTHYPSEKELDALAHKKQFAAFELRAADISSKNFVLDMLERYNMNSDSLTLPFDIIFYIALYMDLQLLEQLANKTSVFFKIWNSELFWERRITVDFPEITPYMDRLLGLLTLEPPSSDVIASYRYTPIMGGNVDYEWSECFPIVTQKLSYTTETRTIYHVVARIIAAVKNAFGIHHCNITRGNVKYHASRVHPVAFWPDTVNLTIQVPGLRDTIQTHSVAMTFKEFLAEFYPSITNYLDMDWPTEWAMRSSVFFASVWWGFIKGDDACTKILTFMLHQ